MKKNIYIVLAMALGVSLQACQNDDNLPETDKELTFSAVTNDDAGTGTRALGDDFFVTGSNIKVTLTTSVSAAKTFTYTYGANRVFKGNPGYHFPLDDTYITDLTAKWPADNVRGGGIKTNQRLLADFKAADWMTGKLSTFTSGIVATDAPVPLVFTRENVMLDFELVGQNTTGLNIESLLIELQTAGNSGSKAFWAYCGNDDGHAQLIMAPGSSILSDDNYLIGRIRVAGQSDDYTIIFPKTNLVLEAGKRYLITLTPQGYFMNAFVYINGFAENTNEGIGIPFQQPTPDVNGKFAIETPLQLVTMSYLIRNYNDGTSFKWSDETYVLTNGFTITDEYASQYIPIPKSLFTGSIIDASNNPVTTISYGGNKILQLFDNNN